MLRSLTPRHWHVLILALLTLVVILPGLFNLPVIDRDEARFAQASIQMAETNDLLNIRFQDEARNKKPAGAYWAQTAMLKIFENDHERRIWTHRLPSVLAALVSILALYWGGSRMVGRDAAFIGAALLAVSTIFVFEGQIAKTDALLCASTTVMLACLGRLQIETRRREVWGFWIALGVSVMIKGPIAPILAAFTLATFWVWKRDLYWARPLLNFGAIVTFVLIWAPWAVVMYSITDGAFFIESLGNDFGGKIQSGQEGHGAPPGLHSALIWVTLWPASFFLLPALIYAAKTVRSNPETQLAQSISLLLCWALPFWLLIELMPTKLPHYGLPIFPAICLIIGATIIALKSGIGFRKTRIIGGLAGLLSSCFLIGTCFFLQFQYGESQTTLATNVICGLAMLTTLIAAVCLWRRKMGPAVASSIASSLVIFIGTYGYLLPRIDNFNTSERISAELKRFAPDVQFSEIHSPHFSEPSLVYHLGKEIDVSGNSIDLSDGSLAIINLRRSSSEDESASLSERARRRGRCLESSDVVDGFNYSKGAPLSLIILREAPC